MRALPAVALAALLAGCIEATVAPIDLRTAITMPLGSPEQGLLFFFNLTRPEHVRYAFEIDGEGLASGCLIVQSATAQWAREARPDGAECAYDEAAARAGEWLGAGAWAVAFRTESCKRPCELRVGHDAPSNTTASFAVVRSPR